MAYSVSNPPAKIAQTIGGKSLWIYVSADDDATTNGAGYYSDALALGMKLGDFILVFDTATPKGSVHYVTTVSGSTYTTAFAAVA